jgi:short-subunit dehydrogenase
MRTLIIGGSGGLGVELAKQCQRRGDEVIVTGRKNPGLDGISFQKFSLDVGDKLAEEVEQFVDPLPQIDRLIYAAGFYQEGSITELEPGSIRRMLDVVMNGAVWFVRELLKNQGQLAECIAITSTAQDTPRRDESVYSAAKAGLAQFANSISLDERVGKVLVAAPGGMKTSFWQMTKHDTSTYNDPTWVAAQIIDALDVEFRYAYVRILRNPPRTEVVETR